MKYGWFILFLCIPFFVHVPQVHAAISSAETTLSIYTMPKNYRTQLTITVKNTDSHDIRYIKLTRPAGDLAIVAASSSYSRTWDANEVVFTGITLPAGQTLDVTLTLVSVDTELSSVWDITVSDSDAGDSPMTPSGDRSFSVSGNPPDTTAPTIANVSLATSTTSFTVSFTTDEPANGTV